MKLRGAIFDQDGLLFDTEKIYQQCWVEAARFQGVEVTLDLPRKFCGIPKEGIVEIVRSEYPMLDIERYCKEGSELAWKVQLESVPEKKPGLMEMLRFCRDNGIRTAVASSSTIKVVEHNLASAGVRDFFDAVVTGEEVEHGKPAPDIFELAAKRIGLIPRECCVFEDAFSGIRGAVAAGCRAVMIPDQVEPTDEIRAICTVMPDLFAARSVFAESAEILI